MTGEGDLRGGDGAGGRGTGANELRRGERSRVTERPCPLWALPPARHVGATASPTSRRNRHANAHNFCAHYYDYCALATYAIGQDSCLYPQSAPHIFSWMYSITGTTDLASAAAIFKNPVPTHGPKRNTVCIQVYCTCYISCNIPLRIISVT